MFKMKKRMSEAEKEKSLGKGISLKWAIASSSGPASMPIQRYTLLILITTATTGGGVLFQVGVLCSIKNS